ncbi:class I SAM-dependent methyltransferase [Bradyrhizobium ottawaense]|uniref:class I SAM-dependent methyltransferase n=1 Tax=Bradyrhizobium ottawaense TaxID=931866 RepID=UPI002AE000E9|nr:class I SAM-dependent methyltransferase [Bradyrhizobium ottawaense]WQN81234.1 class I SAM-dependent methyltransferase [Bradyrhizobium ottawaense]
MTNNPAGLNQRQIAHREVWETKRAIRLLYQDYHRQLFESCPEGAILDIGGGTAHIKQSRPDVVSLDILRFPGIDVVADAHRLPFQRGIFSGVVMLDVLHHLERPIEFLNEASRVLKAGGRLVMIEPAMTTLARRFYHHFHEEPVDMTADPFAPMSIDPNRDPFDANQAVPTLLFATEPARRRVEQTVPSLRVSSVDWHSLFAYPMSGGLQRWSLIPAALVSPTLRFEKMVPAALRKHLSFRMIVVLERV